MKYAFIIKTIFFFGVNIAQAQLTDKKPYNDFYAGIGLGLDYGGIGFKAEFLPAKDIGIFAGAGANFNGVGFNGGLSWKILPDKKVTPFINVMYGYNAVIKVKTVTGNAVFFSKTYYGPSFGAGCEIRTGQRSKVSIGLILPIRNKEFHDKYNELKDAGFDFKPGVLPVLLTIGYNFSGSGKK